METATRVSVIVDADTYFRAARAAMCKARRRIMLIGWDFDPRIALDHDSRDGHGAESVDAFISGLVASNPDLHVHVLRWDVGALNTFTRGSAAFTLLRWMLHSRIHLRLDGHHPFGGSHHQKIVVIDDDVAFCGGIDMTGDRWDTSEHLHDDERRRRPDGRRYGPWHDATTALQGPVATALAELARDRWAAAGGGRLRAVDHVNDCWPNGLTPDFVDLPVAVSRTVPVMEGQEEVVEVERLYLDLIASAERWIYAESQYFASRRIAIAMASRLEEIDGPEIVVVNPVTAQGWIEPIAMDTARGRLMEALRRRDRHGRLRMYHPVTRAGTPIYVHAKILVVDDRILKVGSSNFNNRSLRLDTECDVALGGLDPIHDVELAVAGVRDSLLAEHLGCDFQDVADMLEAKGSLIETVESLRRPAGRTLFPYEVQDLAAIEEWLADHEILDPEGPDEMFESLARRGLFRGW